MLIAKRETLVEMRNVRTVSEIVPSLVSFDGTAGVYAIKGSSKGG
jgi:hypothetical protein